MLETWRQIWRDGFAPCLSIESLQALLHALETDDQRLLQGTTTEPPPLLCTADWPIKGGCILGYCGAVENGGFCVDTNGKELPDVNVMPFKYATVRSVEEFFAKACFDADQLLGEPGGCRHFLNWFDDTPRDEMRRELAAEVRRSIGEREIVKQPSDGEGVSA